MGQNEKRKIEIDLSENIIPENIVYIRASDDINHEAINYIIDLINNDKIIRNPPNTIMIGPRMWVSFKNRDEISQSPTIPVTFRIPWNGEIIEQEGASVRFQERTRSVIGLFHNLFNLESIKIRKANDNELRYYWAICAWDLEEPIFVIEGENIGKFIFDFNNNEIFFIENLTGLR